MGEFGDLSFQGTTRPGSHPTEGSHSTAVSRGSFQDREYDYQPVTALGRGGCAESSAMVHCSLAENAH